MKKFLLVTFILVVLVTNLYGFVSKFVIDGLIEVDPIEASTTTVYVE